MKKLTTLLLAIFVFLAALAQQDFQGTIRYKAVRVSDLNREREKDSVMYITLQLAPNRLHFSVEKTNGTDDEEDILILLDSMKIYFLNKERKTFYTKKLSRLSLLPAQQNETILGYNAAPVIKDHEQGLAITKVRSVAWVNDNLTYHLPEGVSLQEFMFFFHNNHIILKSKIALTETGFSEMDESDDDSGDEKKKSSDPPFDMVFTAVDIKQGPLPDNMFAIPDGYTNRSRTWVGAVDTVYAPVEVPMAATDTATRVQPPPPPPPPPKKPVKAPVKKTGSASSPAMKQD